MRTNRLLNLGFRLAIVPVLAVMALTATAASPQSAEAANVGGCGYFINLSGTAWGKLREPGDYQCFAVNLKGGYTYTITTEVGAPSEAYSTSMYSMLGDSVMTLWAHKQGAWLSPSMDESQFNFVASNDDYNAPTTYGSRITLTVPGEFGSDNLYVVQVRGFGSAIGRYSVTASGYLVASPTQCQIFIGCP